jgi:hypothetical protein
MPHYRYIRAKTYNQGVLTVHYFRNNDAGTLTELAEINGEYYVHAPEDAEIPAQATEIEWQSVAMNEELHDAIIANSPRVRMINEEVVSRIRSRYSVNDEIKCLRLAPSVETQAWNDWTEACRAWGHEQKAALGL